MDNLEGPQDQHLLPQPSLSSHEYQSPRQNTNHQDLRTSTVYDVDDDYGQQHDDHNMITGIAKFPNEVLNQIFLEFGKFLNHEDARLVAASIGRTCWEDSDHPRHFPKFRGFRTLKAIRLVCRRWAEVAAPMLLKRITTGSHLYFYERLSHDIKKGHALRENVQEIVLDITSGARATYLFQMAFARYGRFDDTIKERHVRLQRNNNVDEREHNVLINLFWLLPSLKVVEVDMAEYYFSDRPDAWRDSYGKLKALQRELLLRPHFLLTQAMSQALNREGRTAIEYTLYALKKAPKRYEVRMKHFNIVHLRTTRYEDTRGIQRALRLFRKKVDCLSLHLNFDKMCHSEDERHDEDNATETTRTAGLLRFIRQTSNCRDLRIVTSNFLGLADPLSMAGPPRSHFRQRLSNVRTPMLPKLETLYLSHLLCEPEDLLRFLTSHCPQLRDLALRDMAFTFRTTDESRYQWWTTFFKKLKSQSNLTSLHFSYLFNSPLDTPRKRYALIDVFEFPTLSNNSDLPEVYLETRRWFLDKSLDENDCPLDRFDVSDVIVSERTYYGWHGRDFYESFKM